MRIQESDIRMSSQHEQDYRQEVEVHSERSFRAVLGEVGGTAADKAANERERLVRMLQSLIDAILASLDGKKCRDGLADYRSEAPSRETQTLEARPATREMSWRWEATERFSEHERTRVEAGGVVKTADGKSIDFNVSLDMCRDYSCENKYIQSGDVVLHDPLVINFEGKAAELKGERFAFDLDADGKVEQVPELGSASGFLVLDRNGNGRADDGSELFGTRTGNGFKELAALDADHNGWLDEADPGFAELRVWGGGKDAKDLATLAGKGVGAIWLGSAESQFALKDSANQLLGEIRATGVYLSEDGRAGTVQQVDLGVEAPRAA